jgi:ArsR family transcriptional regulator, arsenate/arsenite/antimonite-responsive transcriptional repressor
VSTMTLIGNKSRLGKLSTKRRPATKISDETLHGLCNIFHLLSDKSRLKILLALARDGEMHVSALCDLLGESQPEAKPASQPAVSHHLTLLRAHHLVDFRRDGKHNYYRIDSGLVQDLLQRFFTDSCNPRQQIQFEDFALVFKPK